MTVAEAAHLLQLNPKRVQALARAGRLPAARIGRKWLFRREDLEGMLGRAVAPPSREGATQPAAWSGVALSARNRLVGRIVRLTLDGLMAEVVLAIGEQTLVSVITRASAERLGLTEGQDVYAVVKSTEVMIGKEGSFA
jgi:molybdate transport system regulatory protein